VFVGLRKIAGSFTIFLKTESVIFISAQAMQAKQVLFFLAA